MPAPGTVTNNITLPSDWRRALAPSTHSGVMAGFGGAGEIVSTPGMSGGLTSVVANTSPPPVMSLKAPKTRLVAEEANTIGPSPALIDGESTTPLAGWPS